MAEYYEKYRKFKRMNANKTIDYEFLFLWKCTLVELVSGFVCFILGMYVIGASAILGTVLLLMTFGLPAAMRLLRENLPRNTFLHLVWLVGVMDSKLPNYLKRGTKGYLGP